MIRTTRYGLAGAAAIAALAISVGSAQALTIVQSQNFGTSGSYEFSNDVDNHTHNWSGTGDRFFNRFNTALGTLNSVRIDITGVRVNGFARGDYRDDDWFSDVEGDTRINSQFIRFRAGSFDRTTSRGGTGESDCDSTSGTSASTCWSSWTITNSALSSIGQTLVSSLGAFTGLGNFRMDVDHTGSHWFNETDGDDGYVDRHRGSFSSNGTIRVVYDYTAPPVGVSEPATVGLFGLGLIGLGLATRRRKIG